MAKYHANVWIEVEEDQDDPNGPPDLGDLREHLEEAVVLDTESHGSLGVVDITIDWDSLKPG